jgi:glycosyltransferase involved in cell wall biosynthesis
LEAYLAEADILACPRIRGINTPMKIFPYLHSGRPVLATDLYTHNQRLSPNEAYLAPADPHGFAQGIVELAENEALRRQLGQNGMAFVEREHTYEAHRRRLNQAYDWIESQL